MYFEIGKYPNGIIDFWITVPELRCRRRPGLPAKTAAELGSAIRLNVCL